MPRRVVHISDSYLPGLGGIEAQVAHLAARQRDAGDDVVVITSTPAAPGDHGITQATEDGLDVRRIAARVPGGYPIHPRAAHHVESQLVDIRPDVVHLHMGILAPTAQASLRVVRRIGLPAVVTVHSVWGPLEPGLRLAERVFSWSRYPIEFASVSEMAAAPLRRVAQGRAEIHILRNGVDAAEWLSEPLPRPRPGVHAVYATRFAPRKRVLPLLEALRSTGEQLAAHDRGVRDDDGHVESGLYVTIAGEGEELGRAEAFLDRHGMSSWVALPGRLSRDELTELYRRADVYLAPGVHDAFSVATQEAQAAGLAMVSRSQSGAAELIEHGTQGLLADTDEDFAEQVARLVTDRALLDRIKHTNRTTPPATDWASVLAAHDAVYALAEARYGAGG